MRSWLKFVTSIGLVLAGPVVLAAEPEPVLTPREIQRLRTAPLRVCVDPNYPPLEWVDADGVYRGIGADFLHAYSESLRFEYRVLATESWAASLARMERGECDLMPMLNETPDRLRYMDFSDPIVQEDTLIVTRDDVGYLDSLRALEGKRLALVPGYRLEETILRDYPAIVVVPTAGMLDALQAVASGEVDATLESLRTVLPLIQQHGLGNLKISGQTPYTNVYRMGVRKGDELLRGAMNKAIAALPPRRAHEIIERGYRVPVVQRTDIRLLGQILALALLVGGVLLWRYRTVRRFNRLLEEKNAELELLSVTDHLTGCFNRLKLDDLLQRETERARRYERPMAVILLDLDLFKQINDQHGHATGDAVLQAVARLLRERVRVSDCVGRWGGEEFLVICTETDRHQAVLLAEQLRERLAAQELLPGRTVTASFGVATLHPAESAELLMRRVDEALYSAKRAGRNLVHAA